jgi:hypothetical protein
MRVATVRCWSGDHGSFDRTGSESLFALYGIPHNVLDSEIIRSAAPDMIARDRQDANVGRYGDAGEEVASAIEDEETSRRREIVAILAEPEVRFVVHEER